MKQNKPGMANKPNPSGRQGSGLTRPGELYVQGDALPQPEVVEKDTDSVWALWSDMVEGEGATTGQPDKKHKGPPDNDFSETVPMDLDALESTQSMDLDALEPTQLMDLDAMEPTQLMDLPDLPKDDKK